MAYIKKYWHIILIIILLVLAILVRLEGFNQPLLDAYYFRQAQTATVVRHFVEDGINLFKPRLDIFGTGPQQYIILESPIYQAAVASLSFILGYSTQLARLVSIISGLLSGICIYFLVFLISNDKLKSFLTLTFFLFFPLSIFVQHAVLIESFVMMLHLLSLLIWLLYIKSEKTWLIILFIPITIFALIGKIIYGPFLLLNLLIFGLIEKKGLHYFLKPKIFVSFLVIAIGTIYWQKTADYLNIKSGNVFYTSQNPNDLLSYMGYFSERLVLTTWMRRGQDVLGSITKISALTSLIGVLVLLRYKNKEKYIFIGWLGSMLLYYLVFFRIQNHIYYFYMIMPIMAIFGAYGLEFIYKIIRKINNRYAYVLLGLFIVYFMYKSYTNSRGYFVIHEDVERKIAIMNRYLERPGPMVLVFPIWDWHSEYTYYTRRIASVISIAELPNLDQYRKKGYVYAIFQDFSPGLIDQNLLKKNNLKLIHGDNGILIAQF